VVNDLVLLPHCDLHVALAGVPKLRMRVFHRLDSADPKLYTLTEITNQCEFEFFAPFNAVGHRLDDLPTVTKATGDVTATKTGIYLFQVRFPVNSTYLVGRMQVHSQLLDWWFGNDSITTAVDTVAHAQPSIYAKFSADAASPDPAAPGAGVGCDLIGDITGHGYVALTPSDPTRFTVNPDTGRLRGLVVTAEPPPTVSGSLVGGALPAQVLPVRVVDYTAVRNDLQPVRAPTATAADDKHNMIFVAEGFRNTKADRDLFDQVVHTVSTEFFEKRRHEPYGLLKDSFNVFKAFLPSQQHTLTTGYTVTDQDGPVPKGTPIPGFRPVSANNNVYTPATLIEKVGLPPRNETRNLANLLTLWTSQGLPDFDPTKVDAPLVEAWKKHRSEGILHARDTVFGMYLGARLADHSWNVEKDPAHPVTKPATDTAGDPMKAYIGRLYQIFFFPPLRGVTMDPRRQAPERLDGNVINLGNIVLSYLSGLRYAPNPALQIGKLWVPDPAKFTPSRGLVAIVCNDNVDGGTNINGLTMTAATLNVLEALPAAYPNPAAPREFRRTPPDPIVPNLHLLIDTVAHEFGHSFNLGDEYEEFDNDDPHAGDNTDLFDNVTHLGVIRLNPASREIDVNKIKWFRLPRVRVSDRLVVDAAAAGNAVQVSIDPTRIASWVQAKKDGRTASLLRIALAGRGQQLPFGVLVERLAIGVIDEKAGTIPLTGVPAGNPTFPKGSLVYVPLTDDHGTALTAVEPSVKTFLADAAGHHDAPLNVDPDHVHRKTGKDNPVTIPGFDPPCKSGRLVGIFEGADHYAGGSYRPTGACKMRSFDKAEDQDEEHEGEFCFVCKWLIVNRVDPSFHALLTEKFYPVAKKNG
jgi:hypothetical protein